MRERPLGAKHFEQAKRYISSMINKAGDMAVDAFLEDSVEQNPGQRLAERSLNFGLIYMTVDKKDQEILLPTSFRGLIAQNEFVLCARELPLRIVAQHLEFRHIQRTSQAMNYKSDDLKYALSFSLVMSEVLGQRMTPESAPVPCLIPHTNGVFLGVAKHKKDFWAETQFACTAKEGRKSEASYVEGSVYGSPVIIELITSLGRQEISSRQTELRDLLLMDDFPECERIMSRGMDIHMLGAMHEIVGRQDKEGWAALCRKLGAIIDSPLWREESQKAMQNIRKNEYN